MSHSQTEADLLRDLEQAKRERDTAQTQLQIALQAVPVIDELKAALADMTKQRDALNNALDVANAENEKNCAVLREHLSNARTEIARVYAQRDAAQAQAAALRTRCAELEAVLQQLVAEFTCPCVICTPIRKAARAALRNPSPAPRAVVTRPDEPPAQARERISQQ